MANPKRPIAFIDLLAQRRRLGDRIDRAVMDAVNSGQWVLGPPVRAFEEKLAVFGQAKHALSCANGTDALVLPLSAWEIGPGDAVFCPSFTFCATAEIVPWLGATPVFVDVLPDTFNMDPAHLDATIEMIKREGKLRPRAVIGVCLFGQAADYPALLQVARRHGLKLIADSAQGFGSTIDGVHPLKWADATTTSFFPAKPLGCYGDGGAVLTDDEALLELMDSYRIHGKATKSDIASYKFEHDPKYMNVRIGRNSRLDTVQAAILLEKLVDFPEEIVRRNEVAERYAKGLAGVVTPPFVAKGVVSTWAQYTILADRRDELAAHLKGAGVPTAIYYPIPLHRQIAYEKFPVCAGGLPVTEDLARKVVSLPMHADLDVETQDYIIASVRAFYGAARVTMRSRPRT